MDKVMSIMVVDDERIVRESFFHWFLKDGHRVEAAATGLEALEKIEKIPFDLLFVDMKMPGMDGIQLLQKVKTEYPDTAVVIITAYGSIDTAVQAMKLGAVDYLLKPFQPDQLSLVLQKVANQKNLMSEFQYVKNRLEDTTHFENIIGVSACMQEVFDLVLQVAQSDSSVLIVGETGTGKELVARAIHAKSKRSHLPFVTINCGAIPDTLLESELFGYQKGAFTGADRTRKGFFEVVSGGTLFLDEIGEISAKMQVDLLRVLEEKKIHKIGDPYLVDVDFRLVAATRKDLEQEVARETFRRDFFYRINVITIRMPPLRERKEDIPLLVEHFMRKYSRQIAKKVDHMTREALGLLIEYEWPGNVRELENVIERAVVLAKARSLGVDAFAFLRASACRPARLRSLRTLEKDYIRQVLQECDWNVTKASRILDINRATLHKMLKRYNLVRP
jgi:two-component system response regulator HydG